MLEILKLCKITYIYIVSCFYLHVLLHHIAAFVLYGFPLTFTYWYVCFACWALMNFTFSGPCVVIYLPNEVIIKQVYHDARSRKCDPPSLYSIRDPLRSVRIRTFFLGTHHMRKNLSSLAENCVLGETV